MNIVKHDDLGPVADVSTQDVAKKMASLSPEESSHLRENCLHPAHTNDEGNVCAECGLSWWLC